MSKKINNSLINCSIEINDMNVIIKGYIINPSLYKKKAIIAPNHFDKLSSFSGSALPFPCEQIAFENTKNYFEINDDGNIDTIFKYPNSYYSADGLTKIISPIIFILDKNKIYFELNDLCPLKTLRDRQRSDPVFYAIKEALLPIATAEKHMINYANAKLLHNIA